MYITTYAADAQPPLDPRRLSQHHDNSSLMSKCKHHLMDSTAMRKQSSTRTLENDISRVTLECDSKGWAEKCEKKKKSKRLFDI